MWISDRVARIKHGKYGKFKENGNFYVKWHRTYYKYKHQHDWLSRIRHAPYGHRHVVPSAVSFAGMYVPPAKPVIVGVYESSAPMNLAGVCALPAKLSADIGRES